MFLVDVGTIGDEFYSDVSSMYFLSAMLSRFYYTCILWFVNHLICVCAQLITCESLLSSLFMFDSIFDSFLVLMQCCPGFIMHVFCGLLII